MSESKIILNAGAVIIENEKLLLVQEAEAPFTGKWNFPIGKVELNEKLTDAAVRETKEETGYDVELVGFLGIYQNIPSSDINVVITMFTAKVFGGELNCDNKEILQCKWFTRDDFGKLEDSDLFDVEMRNVVDRAFNDLRSLDNYVSF
jgi:8-oxo-dGTP diphosphatase